jgi:hypothetical protein
MNSFVGVSDNCKGIMSWADPVHIADVLQHGWETTAG